MTLNIFIVTFGNPSLVRQVGDLDVESLIREKERLLAAIGRSPLRYATIIGAVDFALIVPAKITDQPRSPYWRPHFHLVVITSLSAEEVTSAFKAIRGHKADDLIVDDYRSVITDEFNDPFKQISYLLKSIFWRYERFVDRHENRRSYKVPLKPKQHRELALVLHELGPERRLFLRGAKIVNGRFQPNHSSGPSAL